MMTSPISTEFHCNMTENDHSTLITHIGDATTFQTDNTINISITTSECTTSLPATTQSSIVSAKPHVLPLVYFQTPNSTTKTNTNMVFNTVQISNLNHNVANITSQTGNTTSNLTIPPSLNVPNNQNVILTKPQQLVIQKSSGSPLVPMSVSNNNPIKNTVALLTMIKPMPKQSDVSPNRVQINSISNVRTDNIQIIPNMTNMTQTSGQKYLLTPMPKISSNRLPITATTNCNLQSKIAFMPFNVPSTPIKPDIASKHKVFNFKISNGQLQNDSTPITVLCDTPVESQDNATQKEHDLLSCHESSPEKKLKDSGDKTYELSIVEDSCSRPCTLSIPDENIIDLKNKDSLKHTKQGISILKKSFNTPERKSTFLRSIPNSITTVSDASTKEVKITTNTLFECDTGNLVNVSLPKFPTKPERRRKANFAYRKDYDEVEVSSCSNWDNKLYSVKENDIKVTRLIESENPRSKVSNEVLMEIEVIKEKSTDMNDNFDEDKLLNWKLGVAGLPGTDLKFELNEFGTIEVIPEEDIKKNSGNSLGVKENKSFSDLQEDLCCLECGCYGLPSDFVSMKYCSTTCQEAGQKYGKDKLNRRKKRNMFKKLSESIPNDKDSSDESISNENSQDKLIYPWSCTKKGFSWAKYLDHMKAKAAPVKLFKDPFPYTRNGFRVGMKLEGIDPQHPKYFCVLTVSEVLGYRVRMHFDGYPENYDFWVNADSLDIFPIGWCEKNGHLLHPPPSYSYDEFNWNNYLKQTKSTAAPKHLFASRVPNHCPNAFRVGMKLEAVDKKNSSLVCVATISDMMDNRILVHFDSWDDIYDYWAEPTSPYIHPVGWCDQNGHNLTPPNDHPNPESFSWETYLRETKSLPAPVRAFKQKPSNGFKEGMKLECVDKRVPHLIRVATVDQVRRHQIRIKFDGWPDKYSYWVDEDWPDIHPVGWCHKTGHPLEPPLTPDDVYDFLECATVGCRGQGHIKGPKYATHTSPKYCPYSDENLDVDRRLPDRLLSPDREIESVVPISREPKETNLKVRRVGRPPKIPRLDDSLEIKAECNDEEEFDLHHRRKLSKSTLVHNEPTNLLNGFSVHFKHKPRKNQNWKKHSTYLKQYINIDSNPKYWTEQQVINFVQSVPSCHEQGEQFRYNKIDGDSLLMLTQEDIINVLNLKIGPAVKLYNSILLLRSAITNYT